MLILMVMLVFGYVGCVGVDVHDCGDGYYASTGYVGVSVYEYTAVAIDGDGGVDVGVRVGMLCLCRCCSCC